MPNEVHANIVFYGPKVDEFRNNLKSIVKKSTIDMDDLYDYYHISEETRDDRTYIEDLDLDEKDKVMINTWNAWFPRVDVWSEIYEHFCSDDGDEGIAYQVYAEDQDNPFHIVNTDYTGKYFDSRYKVMYADDDDGEIFDEYEFFSSLDEATSFVKKNEIEKYCIFEFFDDVDMFDEQPIFYDSDGNEVEPPEDYY